MQTSTDPHAVWSLGREDQPTEPFGPSSRWWWLPALLLTFGIATAGAAYALGQIAPDYEAILMIGQLQSGKLRVALWAAAVSLLLLAMLATATILAVRRDSTFFRVVVGLSWVAALPVVGAISVVTALSYDQQPETYKFSVGDQDYILASQIGFLIAADDTDLDLYRKDGRLYRDVELRLPYADTGAFNRGGFSLDREGVDTWIVYVSGADETVRVKIP